MRKRRLFRWLRSAQGRRLSHMVPALAVFGVAAWQSYWHTVEVATRYGEGMSASIMPFSIDGLMVTAARYITHARTRVGRMLSFVGFLLGVAATGTSNVLAADPVLWSRVWALWPAVAMVTTASMLHWGELTPVRRRPRRARAAVAPLRTRKIAAA